MINLVVYMDRLFTFIACEVRMDGDIRDYAMFWSGLNIPFCPSSKS
jgi:hypothetical protein